MQRRAEVALQKRASSIARPAEFWEAGDGRSPAMGKVAPPEAASERPSVPDALRPARFAAKTCMGHHLHERLVSDALSHCEFSGLCYVGFGQAQRNLDAGDFVQLTDKARAS